MGLIDPSQMISYRRLPGGVVVLVSVVGGIALGYFFSILLLESFAGFDGEGTSTRAIMYWFHKRGFHPTDQEFWYWYSLIDTWAPILLTVISSFLFVYLLNRILKGARVPWIVRRPGYCVPCGYNLGGNVSGICPECGTPITQEEDDPAGLFTAIVLLLISLFLISSIVGMLMPSLA